MYFSYNKLSVVENNSLCMFWQLVCFYVGEMVTFPLTLMVHGSLVKTKVVFSL